MLVAIGRVPPVVGGALVAPRLREAAGPVVSGGPPVRGDGRCAGSGRCALSGGARLRTARDGAPPPRVVGQWVVRITPLRGSSRCWSTTQPELGDECPVALDVLTLDVLQE